ncbi:MAG: TlpA family protein disulfide reductase [Deltaproteobacteria bacterium]|nr:TlpA family protein disulfide reductase [Deltaproteobacteria bacterium]
MTSKRRVPLVAPLCLLLALLLAAGCSKKEKSSQGSDIAPSFSLVGSDGQKVDLSNYKGKVVLLDFWASWCPPCRAAIPHVVELQQTLGPQGFQAIGLNLDENPDDLATFLKQNPVNYPVAKADETVREAYGGISAIPQIFLIDRKGRIREHYQGFTAEIAEKVRKAAEALLQDGA